MSIVDRMFPKGTRANGATATPQPPDGGTSIAAEDLLRRREQLADKLAELQWDLGGLAYEMAIRDHFRPDVLARVAARLQEVDAELGGVERLLRLEQAGASGNCSSCRALYARGAVYCWQCGAALMERAPISRS